MCGEVELVFDLHQSTCVSSLLTIVSGACVLGHGKPSCAKGEIGRFPRRNSTKNVRISCELDVSLEERPRLIGVHVPLDDGARQIPSNIAGAWKEMIVAMGHPIDLDDPVAELNPLVGLHPSIDDDHVIRGQL